MLTSQSSETSAALVDPIELTTEGCVSRILLVIGDPTLRIAVLSRFRLMGIDVEVASNGDLALEKLRRNQIDAVFLDLLLRETDSARVIKRIRKDREFAELPIFGYASSFSARQVRKVTKAGATKIFSENDASIDVIVAEIGFGLFEGGRVEGADPEKPAEGTTATDQLTESVNRVRRHVERLDDRSDETLSAGYGELRGKVQRVANLAMRSGRYDMARLASALQSVLKVFHEIPEHATESSLHTVTVAFDVLNQICPNAAMVNGPPALQFSAAIVDDEMVSRSIVCSALRSVGFTFEVFTHPAEILRHTSSHKTDLVVVNMCAEETAGFDVCQKLREQHGAGTIPVLFASGISDFRDRKKVISQQFSFWGSHKRGEGHGEEGPGREGLERREYPARFSRSVQAAPPRCEACFPGRGFSSAFFLFVGADLQSSHHEIHEPGPGFEIQIGGSAPRRAPELERSVELGDGAGGARRLDRGV